MTGAQDANKNPYNVIVEDLKSQGVTFEVCQITLRNRKLETKQFIPEVTLHTVGRATNHAIAKSRGLRVPEALSCMGFSVTVRPSGRTFSVENGETVLEAALRNGVGLPYGCKNGACGTCRGKLIEGQLVHRAHSSSALSCRRRSEGLRALLLVASSKRRCHRGARAHWLRRYPDSQNAGTHRKDRMARARCRSDLAATADQRATAVSRRTVSRFHPGGWRAPPVSIATAPHADELIQLHIRRTPGGVFTDRLFGAVEPAVKERDILRIEAPLGTFFLREDNTRPIVLLAGGTGFAPVKAIAEHVFHKRINREEADKPARDVYLYWGARARPDLYMQELPGAVVTRAAEFPVYPACCRSRSPR